MLTPVARFKARVEGCSMLGRVYSRTASKAQMHERRDELLKNTGNAFLSGQSVRVRTEEMALRG